MGFEPRISSLDFHARCATWESWYYCRLKIRIYLKCPNITEGSRGRCTTLERKFLNLHSDPPSKYLRIYAFLNISFYSVRWFLSIKRYSLTPVLLSNIESLPPCPGNMSHISERYDHPENDMMRKPDLPIFMNPDSNR
jgi:hypothetical protein